MLVGEPALEVRRVGLADGRIGGELDARPLHETACRHNDFAVVAGHIPRFEMNETIDGRALLHRLDETRKFRFRVEANGAGDIGGQLIGRREVFISQSIEARADEEPPFERLRDGVRREKEPLIVVLIAVGIGADLPADGGRGETVFDARDAPLFACDVAARGSEPAPGVLDERADDDVCPDFGGLPSKPAARTREHIFSISSTVKASRSS